MRYVGGKTRISGWVADQIRAVRLTKDYTSYYEPFLGSGAVAARVCPLLKLPYHLSDAHFDLMAMWTAVADGWDPPLSSSKEEYERLRHAPTSALRGLVGFGASFSGKWFGGYVGTAWDAYHNRYTNDYFGAARRSVLDLKPLMTGAASLACCSYRELRPGSGALVYCDPPYAGTLGFGVSFDTRDFFSWVRARAAAGAIVLVSEYAAPADFAEIASRPRKAMLRATKSEEQEWRTERLFTLGATGLCE